MLDNGGNCCESAPMECKRDLDGELQRLNKRIESHTELYNSLKVVAQSDSLYNVSDNKSRKELAALIGSTIVELENLYLNWERLVKDIEKEES